MTRPAPRRAGPATIRRMRSKLSSLWRDPQFRRGARGMLPFVPGIAAWGVVTGVAMVKGGLAVPLALLMSFVVYAGTAQLAALPLLAAGAPVWVIVAAAFCVNLRFVIYSAQWRVHFEHLPRWQRLALVFFAADLNIAAFQRDWPAREARPGQVPYFIGGVALIWVTWQAASIVGIVLAEGIPARWGLGFAGTLAMLGLTYGLIRDRTTWVAAAVAGTAAVAAFALPLKLNIVVAIAAAVAAGLLAEQAARAHRSLGGAR
jgi:predicted branched-subunit amino acid permease